MPSILLYPLVSFLVSLTVTLLVMPWLLRFCKERGLYDMPNDRKVHKNKIPRMGGVLFAPAMIIGMVAVMVIMVVRGEHDLISFGLSTTLLFAALFLIYSIGLIDDVLGLDAKIKFTIQFLAALFMPVCNLYINNLYGFCGFHEIPAYVGYPLTIFISLLIINAVNLIDGIDGLASGLGIICIAVFTGIFINLESLIYPVFTMGMLGTLIAFFYFNMFGKVEKGTKTFMGDTGSLILGYVIAFLCIKYAMFNPNVFSNTAGSCPILVSYTLVILPVFDLCRVAVERLLKHKGIFSPDKTHMHHLFLASGFSMHRTLACMLGLQVFFDILNAVLFFACHVPSSYIVPLDIVVYSLVVVALKRTAKRGAA